MKAKPGYSARALLMFRDEAVGAERAITGQYKDKESKG